MDFDRENMNKVMGEYADCLCPKCEERLKERVKPIAEKLNSGESPSIPQMTGVLDSLCYGCMLRIRKRRRELHA